MEAKTPKEFFEKVLPSRFKPEKARGIDVSVRVTISGANGGDWTVTIKDQKIDAREGTTPTPTLSIAMTDADFMDLMSGKLSGERAFFSGKIKFQGNITVALRLREAGFL